MKYAVIGTGKTGQAVLDKLPADDVVAVCNSRHPPTPPLLRLADIGIVFVPGQAFGDLLPLLLDSALPVVIGTTGYIWPSDLDQKLKERDVAWVLGQNFSLGLNVMRYFAEQIKRTMNVLRQAPVELRMTEKHHIHKLDAPSGTALYLAEALDVTPASIVSLREGDAKGTHTVSFDWPYDRLLLTHEALDRAAFAEGVLEACRQLPALAPGLHHFETLADDRITQSLKG